MKKRVVILGSGNVATSIALALNDKCEMVQIYSRTLANAQELARKVGCQAISDLRNVAPDADVYIISVKDDAIASVVDAVPDNGALWLHTSGSTPIDVFREKRSRYGVLYPMQSFSKERTVYFAEIPTFIEANDDKTKQVIRQLAESVTQHVIEVSSDDRQYLHLAAVFACNFTNHCCTLAGQVLETAGVKFDVLLPLVEETVTKLRELPPSLAQTGPAARHDTNVMQAQAALLDKIGEGSGNPLLAEIYRTMSESIVQTTTINNI